MLTFIGSVYTSTCKTSTKEGRKKYKSDKNIIELATIRQ